MASTRTVHGRRINPDADRKLWAALRGGQLSGFKFRRQQPVDHHVADFLCREAKLIVELDGGQHVGQGENSGDRTRALEAAGYRVLRFWGQDVLTNADNVVEAILLELRLSRL